MTIELLMILATMISPLFSSRSPALEQVMHDTLKQVMRCSEWEDDEDSDRPLAAFSPARYLQLVALVRKESGENACGRRNHLPFHLHNPRSWNFCAMGICSGNSCSCFKNFVGEKCSQFQGHCWLFYCRLVGCNREAPSLYCSCNPSLYGTPVARGIYFYDHGFETTYIPPPPGYLTTDFVDSHLIREVSPGQFEIIGGNYHLDSQETRSSGIHYRKYSHPSYPRFVYNNPAKTQDERFSYDPHFDSAPEMYPRRHPRPQRKGAVSSYLRRQNFQNGVYPKENAPMYSPQAFKYRREDGDFENADLLERFPPATEGASRRNSAMEARYFNNRRDAGFRYRGDNFRSKWQARLPYFPDREASLRNEWYRGNYVSGKISSNGAGENKRYIGGSPLRRQKTLERNTIRDAWAEDEDDEDADDESGDNEDFKFPSGSPTFGLSTFLTYLYSTIIIFIVYCFLE